MAGSALVRLGIGCRKYVEPAIVTGLFLPYTLYRI